MSQVMEQPRPRPMPTLQLFGAALHVFILLCWAGIVPVWLLLPPPLQAEVEPVLRGLTLPALALCGAILLAAMLRLAGLLYGESNRLADTGLRLGGIAFAGVALKAITGLSLAGAGLDWQATLFLTIFHTGAIVALLVLPWVAAIVLIVAVLSLLRRDPRPC